jgi:hypothetical protein
MGSFVDSCFECFATVLPASKGFYSRGYGDLDHAMELRGELMTQLAKGEEPALIDVEWSGKEVKSCRATLTACPNRLCSSIRFGLISDQLGIREQEAYC